MSQQKLFYPGWNALVSNSKAETSRLTSRMPPLKFYSDNQIDLEFAPLILVDEVIIDEDSFASVVRSKSSKFARLRNSLRELHESEFLKTRACQKIILANKKAILDTTAQDLKEPSTWLPAIRDALLDWESTRGLFKRAFPRRYDAALHYPYGAYCAMLEDGIQPSEDAYEKYRKIVFSEEHKNSAELDVIRMIASPYLNYVNSNITLMKDIEAAPVDWSTFKGLYQEKMQKPIEDRASRVRSKTRELFINAPTWEPENVQQLLAILTDGRVADLREYVSRLLADMHVRQNRSRNLRLSVATASAALSSISTLLGAPVSVSPATGLVRSAAERLMGDEHKWLYCLLDAKSAPIPSGQD